MILSYIGKGCHRGSFFLLRQKCFQGRSLATPGSAFTSRAKQRPKGHKDRQRTHLCLSRKKKLPRLVHPFRSRMVLSYTLNGIPKPKDCSGWPLNTHKKIRKLISRENTSLWREKFPPQGSFLSVAKVFSWHFFGRVLHGKGGRGWDKPFNSKKYLGSFFLSAYRNMTSA